MKETVMVVRVMIGLTAMLSAVPATAQVSAGPSFSSAANRDDEQLVGSQQLPRTLLNTNQAGRTASSSVGQAGQRQTRESAATEAGIKPMARIASRVQNRVQNRIRNRIDRYYDPQAGATDPFAVAEDQMSRGGRASR